jgi:hypothetical protein
MPQLTRGHAGRLIYRRDTAKAAGSRAGLPGFPGVVGLLLCLSCLSCPLNLPEKVQLKASPSIYMPIGSPLGASLGDLTDGLGKLTNLDITPGSGSGTTLIYDYQGPEYGDTRVVMVVMKELVNVDIGGMGSPTIGGTVTTGITLAEAAAVLGQPFPPVSLPAVSPSPGTNDNIDLSDLFNLLNEYDGLEFRSVPAYLYIDGPARIFQGGNVSYTLKFDDGSITPSSFTNTVVPLPLPGNFSSGILSPKPTALEMAGVFNGKPSSLKAEIDFTIGAITINSLDELRAFAADLRTPLSANLVLLLPFQFSASSPIPVFAGPDDSSNPNPNPAIKLMDSDLLGRDGEGAMDDMTENLQSLTMELSIVNNLGINGYIKMLKAMPTPASPSPAELEGTISLSGKSSITIPKATLETVPFSPALEIYLDGDFDIKRSLPPEGAMTMNMAIILRTAIDMTF